MMSAAFNGHEHPTSWFWHASAAFLILSAGSAHVAYLSINCPLDLASDEAHYWDWSRHLDWSYYSKGPVVAYLIRAGCALAGDWSREFVGSEMLAVRLPAVLCGCLLLASLYVLTIQVYGRPGLALAVVAFALSSPVIAAGCTLMTIDAPYACCWTWALVLGHRALFCDSRLAWPCLGLTIGLGILAKYTMVLWLPSLVLFLLSTPACRDRLRLPDFWLMVMIVIACCLPVFVWNLKNNWVTFRHVGGQAGLSRGPGLRWLGPLEYLGMQSALLLGFWFVAWVAAMVQHCPWRESDTGVRYLWWMSAPMFCVFLLFSLKTPEEPNWPVAAYLSGLVLTAAWVDRQLRSRVIWYRRLALISLLVALGLGFVVAAALHRSDWLQPLLARFAGPPTVQRPLPLRRFDPTCRLRGKQFLAAAVDRLRGTLRVEGIEPLVAGSSWTIPGELGFYCQGHPIVYSFGPALGDRHSQYDLWHPNPVDDPDIFIGRTFILVGATHDVLRQAFDKVDPPRSITYYERGQPLARWTITVGRSFRGFPRPRGALEDRSF
jgi:hypothetical protein